MIVRRTPNSAWAITGAIVLVTGIFLMAWTWHWLGDSRYGGVATIDETISRRMDHPAPEITSGVEVSQTFVASDNDLTEVQLFLGTYIRTNTSPLVFTLRDSAHNVVATSQVDPATVLDNAYRPFIFDRIVDSRGKTYEATLTSPSGQSGNAFTAWISACDCYPKGELSISGVPHPDEDLVMRVDYHHDGVTTWRELLNRMSQYKPTISKGAGLVLLTGIGALFTLAALAYVTFSLVSTAEAQGEDRPRPLMIACALIVALIVVLLTGAYQGI
jgi:hypothetical protein